MKRPAIVAPTTLPPTRPMRPAPATVESLPMTNSHVDRQIDGRSDEGEHREEDRGGRRADHFVAKNVQRNQRFRRAPEMDDQHCAQEDAGGRKRQDGRRGPGQPRAAQRQHEHQRDRRRGNERGPDNIEPVLAPHARQAAEPRMRHEECERADREIDPEDQRPREVLGEEAAEDRAGDARSRPNRRDIDDIARALAWAARRRRSRSATARQGRRRRAPARRGRK